MGMYIQKHWESNELGMTRLERQGGNILTYLPDKISNINPTLDSSTINALTQAQEALICFNGQSSVLTKTEGVARLLLKAEAIGSSHIEGLTIGARRLLKAELNLTENEFCKDEKASEIIGNIHAMEEALSHANNTNSISVDTLLTMHKKLLENTRISSYGGQIRKEQNWIGGNSYSPFGAIYIPPAPEYIEELLEDLADFCNRENINPIIQAAFAHAQFETIHPFVDGNGRSGRALIHLILKRRQACTNFVPPISLILSTHAKSYSECLNNYRSDNADVFNIAINKWIEFFSNACIKAVEQSISFENKTNKLIDNWIQKLGGIRKDSHGLKLLHLLPGMPIFTSSQAAAAVKVEQSNIIPTLNRFEQSGILKQVNAGKRNRVYEAIGTIELYNMFERQLASPAGDTLIAKPSRAVVNKVNAN